MPARDALPGLPPFSKELKMGEGAYPLPQNPGEPDFGGGREGVKLFLIKHAMPAIDTGVPVREWRLSGAGREGAQRLADQLSNKGIAGIFTSTELKAIETGEILASRLGIPCSRVDGLHEHERSQVGYVDREQFEQQVERLFRFPDQVVFGSESADQAFERFAGALEGILQSYQGRENLAVVSHGTVISLFAERKCGMDGYEVWKRLGLPSYLEFIVSSFKLIEIHHSL